MNKETDTLVTVYITNHNYGKFIQQAIQSVFNQSYNHWELIIIDDGSTDDSKSIIEEYRSDFRVKIIYQKNKGLNVTNNIALRVAAGEFIMRLDADDYLDPNALLVMTNKLRANPELGLVFPDYFIVDSEGNIVNVERRNSFKEGTILLDQPAHGACTLIRKSYLESVGGYDEEFGCQDGYELWVKFTAKYQVENVETPLFYYRQHGKNLTSNENRILETRASIKSKYVQLNKYPSVPVLAVIPVRDAKFNSNQLTFRELNGKSILAGKIEEALRAQYITKVLISSPDVHIKEFLDQHYPGEERILFHHRSANLAQLNIGLSTTLSSVLEYGPVQELSPEVLMVLSTEYPFSNAADFDDAVNTLIIFDTDSVISVRKDNNVYYQHHGQGMKAILGMDKFSKLEREILYQYAGGIIAVRTEAFNKSKELITGMVGHTVISQKSSFRIQTDFDLKLAQKMSDL